MRLGFYRHFKGGEYEVIGVGHHSETGEQLVIYYGGALLWVRPYDNFIEEVDVDGKKVPRFTWLRSPDGKAS
jgi:hypothetical protein